MADEAVRVVILAGGLGTRLAEETEVRPKPMVEIGGRPILWHIMKHYDHYGFSDFLIALGYKGDIIKRFFMDYYMLSRSLTIRLATGETQVHDRQAENWTVNLIDTGLYTNTGGRVKRLEPWLRGGTFMLTYGDGVSDVNLRDLLRFHRAHGKLVTVTAVRPPSRFGGLVFDGDSVVRFMEKPQIGEGWINGGFLVCEPGIFDYLEGDSTSFEAHLLERLAQDNQVVGYKHDAFWQCMDTLRDLRTLEGLWNSGTPPWKLWGEA
jgi:glucose-1-phosphate cytidylyltransferase